MRGNKAGLERRPKAWRAARGLTDESYELWEMRIQPGCGSWIWLALSLSICLTETPRQTPTRTARRRYLYSSAPLGSIIPSGGGPAVSSSPGVSVHDLHRVSPENICRDVIIAHQWQTGEGTPQQGRLFEFSLFNAVWNVILLQVVFFLLYFVASLFSLMLLLLLLFDVSSGFSLPPLDRKWGFPFYSDWPWPHSRRAFFF